VRGADERAHAVHALGACRLDPNDIRLPRGGLLCVALLAILLSPSTTGAEGTSLTSFEINLVAAHAEQEGWSGEVPHSQRNSVGFEHFARLAGPHGDFLTLNVQARISYDTSVDADDALALELHNAFGELRLGLGKRVRVGHFAPEFGLEPSLDTHATLLQTLAIRDIGFKKDWGIGYRVALDAVDVGVAAQLGAGMGIQRRDGSYLVSARLSTPERGNPVLGLSALLGEVLTGTRPSLYPTPDYGGHATSKRRLGADASYVWRRFSFAAELSSGKNDGAEILGGALLVEYTPGWNDRLAIRGNLFGWMGDPDDGDALWSEVALVGSYRVTSRWTLRLLGARELASGTGSEQTRLAVQAYYLGG